MHSHSDHEGVSRTVSIGRTASLELTSLYQISSVSNSSCDSWLRLNLCGVPLAHLTAPSPFGGAPSTMDWILLDFCQHLTNFGFGGNLLWMCLKEGAYQNLPSPIASSQFPWHSPWTSSQLRTLYITSFILSSPRKF